MSTEPSAATVSAEDREKRSLLTNWQFFKRYYARYVCKPCFPQVVVFDLASPPLLFEGFPEPVGGFDDRANIIYISREHDCWPLRVHEWGHWLVWRADKFIDTLWELPWWGLGMRAMFLRRREPLPPEGKV